MKQATTTINKKKTRKSHGNMATRSDIVFLAGVREEAFRSPATHAAPVP